MGEDAAPTGRRSVKRHYTGLLAFDPSSIKQLLEARGKERALAIGRDLEQESRLPPIPSAAHVPEGACARLHELHKLHKCLLDELSRAVYEASVKKEELEGVAQESSELEVRMRACAGALPVLLTRRMSAGCAARSRRRARWGRPCCAAEVGGAPKEAAGARRPHPVGGTPDSDAATHEG